MKDYGFHQHGLGFVVICICVLGLIVLGIQGCRSGSAQDLVQAQSTFEFQTKDDLQRELKNLYASVKQTRTLTSELKGRYAQVQLEILRCALTNNNKIRVQFPL